MSGRGEIKKRFSHLSVWQSVWLSVAVSTFSSYHSIYPSVPINLPVFVYPRVCVCQTACPSVRLSVCLSVYLKFVNFFAFLLTFCAADSTLIYVSTHTHTHTHTRPTATLGRANHVLSPIRPQAQSYLCGTISEIAHPVIWKYISRNAQGVQTAYTIYIFM